MYIHASIEIHDQANMKTCRTHLSKTRHDQIHKILSSSDLNVKKLTLHFDAIVLPYVVPIWTNTAHSLVHLEVQFRTNSIFALSNLSADDRQSFRSITRTDLGNSPLNGVEAMVPIFRKLRTILPERLESLDLHQRGGMVPAWILSSFILGPNDFPHLRKLHLSNLPLDNNLSLGQLITARIPSLRSLALEKVSDSSHHFLRHLSGTDELRALSLSLVSARDALRADILPPNQLSPLIHRYPCLRRLDITPFSSDYRDSDVVFVLLVELGRGCSRLEELNVYTRTFGYRHLRAVLLFLPWLTKLTFASTKYCEWTDEWAEIPEDSTMTLKYTFSNLGLARRSLGRNMRREMAMELGKDVKAAYHRLVTAPQCWEILNSSIKKALKEGYFMERSELESSDGEVDHKMMIQQLVETCTQQLEY
ncbi:hypothetical protein DL96DRAFT_525283 [Flagelloscypha sp. PMI_526]|nr:hypothetical protein DL96DRAFT_525283 [Flagelloscypha sp. PMI_526]